MWDETAVKDDIGKATLFYARLSFLLIILANLIIIGSVLFK